MTLSSCHSGQSPILFSYFDFFVRFFLGLPTGSERTRRPSTFSSLLRKLSVPSGLPVCVLSLSRPSSDSSIPAFSSFRHR